MSKKVIRYFAKIILISTFIAAGALSEEGMLLMCRWNKGFNADVAGGDKAVKAVCFERRPAGKNCLDGNTRFSVKHLH